MRMQDVGLGIDTYLSMLEAHHDSHSDDYDEQSALIDLLIACVDEDVAGADAQSASAGGESQSAGLSSSSSSNGAADAKPAYLVNAETIVSAGA